MTSISDKTTKFFTKIISEIMVALLTAICAPIVLILSINHLFGCQVDITFYNWLAIFGLAWMIKALLRE